MNRRRQISVEIAGLPGSGKSFVLRRLLRHKALPISVTTHKQRVGELILRKRWHSYGLGGLARSPTRRLAKKRAGKAYHQRSPALQSRLMMEFAGQHPELARWIVAAVHHSDAPPDQGFLLLTWFGRLFADYRMVHGTQEVDELMLFDEGFAQKAFSLMLHLRLAADAVREYVKLVPLPDYLLMVDAPESVAYKRLDGRGWPGWIAPKGNAEKAAFLKRCLAVQDALLDGCRDRNIPVIVLDNEREDARELDRHLQTLTKRMAGEPEHG